MGKRYLLLAYSDKTKLLTMRVLYYLGLLQAMHICIGRSRLAGTCRRPSCPVPQCIWLSRIRCIMASLSREHPRCCVFLYADNDLFYIVCKIKF
jgi:hypothetical protein